MKLGNTSFNVEEAAKLSKEEFVTAFKGKLDYDVHLAFETIQKHAPKKEVPFCETVKDAKPTRASRPNKANKSK